MDGAVAPFVEEVRRVRLHPPAVPFLSDVTGTWITDEQATDPAYWGQHLRGTVRFADALDVLLADPGLALLEVGPGDTLVTFARRHRAWHDDRTAVGTLRHPRDRRDDRAHLLESLGTLWSAGVPVDWDARFADEDRRLVRLPGYAFERQRYWIDPDSTATADEPEPVLSAAARLDDWFHVPTWRRLPADGGHPRPDEDTVWAVLGTDLALGGALARRLEDDGATVVRVAAGDALDRAGDRSWTLSPTSREHLTDLLKSLDADGAKALRVVHLWSTAVAPAARLDAAALDAARRAGFDSLLALAQAAGDVRPTAPLTVDVLGRGLYDVTGEEALQPENAGLLGAATVVPQEVEGTLCRVLDVTGADPHHPGEETVDDLVAVLRRPVDDRELALRGRHWWVRDFAAVALPESAGARPRDGGVHLVTGGLGGIGLALAEHLATTATRPVIGLLGRSPFPAEEDWDAHLAAHDDRDPTSGRIRRLRALREAGARVVVLQGDVTDAAQLRRAVAELRRHGPLSGVVHAAGLPSRGLITGKSRQDADEVLAAKTLGTLVLADVLDETGDELDFLVLCSSLTALLGGPGQSDYCAANAFLDAWAQWRRRTTGTPVTAIAWDTWRGIGMAAGLAARLGPGAEPEGEPTGHPLLRRLGDPAGETRTYVTTLTTADSWIVDDHRIMGHGLVPGTTYLELVRAAVADRAEGRDVELHDVLFALPVVVPDGRTRRLHTTVEPHGDRLRFTVRSNDGTADAGTWQTHAVGTVTFREAEAEAEADAGAGADHAPVRDLDALRRELGDARLVAVS